MKVCSGCKQNLPLTYFNKHKLGVDGLNPRCRGCRSKAQKERRDQGYRQPALKYLYGITLEDLNDQLHKQNNKCLICTKSFDEVKPVVDHCHDTGKFRGVLCGTCNSGLGMLKDNLENLKRAVEYLSCWSRATHAS